MNECKFIVFTAPNQAAVENMPVPVPGPGQLLVKTRRSLISIGTELTALKADYPPDSNWAQHFSFPHQPGYSNIGEVVGYGEGVDETWLGKIVASHGIHASHVVVETTDAVPVPEGVSEDHAVFFTIAHIVMNGLRRAKITWGESVVIYGLGLLGQMTAQFCYLAGARPVIGVDISNFRLGLLPEKPGITRLDPTREKIADRVRDLTRGRMADVVVELTGNAELIPSEFEPLKTQGRFVILSSPRGKTTLDLHDLCNAPSHTIIGAHNFSHPPIATPDNPWTIPRHTALFFDFVRDNAISIERLITKRVFYKDAPRIYDELLQNISREMGIVFEW
ncbi:MAG: zinc-binding alcohol dehydrogenase [Kiritimatiellae bacterium]|nr:zinc-binding alcohol dehydrogenase [Kiritimatiellia bacterium]